MYFLRGGVQPMAIRLCSEGQEDKQIINKALRIMSNHIVDMLIHAVKKKKHPLKVLLYALDNQQYCVQLSFA